MRSHIALVPNNEGKFPIYQEEVTQHHVLRSGVPGTAPTTEQLHIEGMFAYNYADDIFFVRRGDRIVKYKAEAN